MARHSAIVAGVEAVSWRGRNVHIPTHDDWGCGEFVAETFYRFRQPSHEVAALLCVFRVQAGLGCIDIDQYELVVYLYLHSAFPVRFWVVGAEAAFVGGNLADDHGAVVTLEAGLPAFIDTDVVSGVGDLGK